LLFLVIDSFFLSVYANVLLGSRDLYTARHNPLYLPEGGPDRNIEPAVSTTPGIPNVSIHKEFQAEKEMKKKWQHSGVRR
jgi:hypothetical protein